MYGAAEATARMSYLPWKNLNVDLVVEATGRFTNREDSEKHIAAGSSPLLGRLKLWC